MTKAIAKGITRDSRIGLSMAGRRDGGIYGVRIEASDAFQSEKM